MCEMLVMNQDNENEKITDPILRARGLFARGHVVAIKPDGWQWGRKEVAPKFHVLDVVDATVEEMQRYLHRLFGRGPSEIVRVPDDQVDNAYKAFGDRDDIYDWVVRNSSGGQSDVEVFLNMRHNIRELRIDENQLTPQQKRGLMNTGRTQVTKQQVIDVTVQEQQFDPPTNDRR